MSKTDSVHIYEHIPLNGYTTFHIGGPARYFAEIATVDQLFQALVFAAEQRVNHYILGGGSNVLISGQGVDGLVLRLKLAGISILEESATTVRLRVAAGECWDDVVAFAVRQGWWGIENLSHIPGNAGAFPIQNVGAYGQQASDVVDYVEAYDTATDNLTRLSKAACGFGYRRSLFNHDRNDRYIILNITLTLRKSGEPCRRYQDVAQYFDGHSTPSLQDMRAAILDIRRRKLPDPDRLGNAGSFFKNIVLDPRAYQCLYHRLSRHVGSSAAARLEDFRRRAGAANEIKIPTAFLLEVCGLRTLRVGGAALYDKHPLIIVNAIGTASADDVMCLVRRIRREVYQATGVPLTPEPRLLGFSPDALREYFALPTDEQTSSA
jgi:UDP-N-acetylmuramate dehydrogenase